MLCQQVIFMLEVHHILVKPYEWEIMALRIWEKNHFHQDSLTNLTLLLVLLPFSSCNISTNHVSTIGESPAPK